jgi:hypothetical protein
LKLFYYFSENSNVYHRKTFSIWETQTIINRMGKLDAYAKENHNIGKMSVDQMLAHCNVTWWFDTKHKKPSHV